MRPDDSGRPPLKLRRPDPKISCTAKPSGVTGFNRYLTARARRRASSRPKQPGVGAVLQEQLTNIGCMGMGNRRGAAAPRSANTQQAGG